MSSKEVSSMSSDNGYHIDDNEPSKDMVQLSSDLRKMLYTIDAADKALEDDIKLKRNEMETLIEALREKVDLMRNELEISLADKKIMKLNESKRLKAEVQGLLSEIQKLEQKTCPSANKIAKTVDQKWDSKIREITVKHDLIKNSIAEFAEPSRINIFCFKPYYDFCKTPFNEFYEVCFALPAKSFRLKKLNKCPFKKRNEDVSDDDDEVWFEVSTIEINDARPKCSSWQLRDFNILYEIGKDKPELTEFISLTYEDLSKANVIFPFEYGFNFKLNHLSKLKTDLILHVKLSDHYVKGSPQVISVRHNTSFAVDTLPSFLTKGTSDENANNDDTNEVDPDATTINEENCGNEGGWRNVDPTVQSSSDVTRTGKNYNDLDESDMRAMAIESDRLNIERKGGLSTVTEESNEGIESTKDSHQRSPIAATRPNHFQGPRSSPMPNRKLPLDEPSPLTPSAVPRTTVANEVPQNRAQFLPDTASTANVVTLGEQLKALRNSHDELESKESSENDGNNNASLVAALGQPCGTAVDIANFQRDLSGENQANGNNAHDTILPELEQVANKSVSFNPQITIYQATANPNDGDITLDDIILGKDAKDNVTLKDLLQESKGKVRSGIKIGTGMIKTNDGEMKLHKAILSSYSKKSEKSTIDDDGFDDTIFSRVSAVSIHSDWTMDSGRIPHFNFSKDVSIWDQDTGAEGTAKSRKEPEYDLSDKKMKLLHLRSVSLTGLPHGISRHVDANKDLTFVSDVHENKIEMFRSWKYEGTFQPKWDANRAFVIPRYVHCFAPRHVAVLDSRALYIFKSDGTLVRTLFDGEAGSFRCLSHYDNQRKLITTETTSDVVKIVFIDYYNKRDRDSEIRIEPTAGKASQTKVRFLAQRADIVVTSDLEQGQIYITSLKTHETIVCRYTVDGANSLKQVMGVDIDPAGNILAVSSYHRRIEVFSKEGQHCRTFRLDDMAVCPTSICLQGSSLYLIDSKGKKLLTYSVGENSKSEF